MSRKTCTAAAVLIATSFIPCVRAERWSVSSNDPPVPVVSWDDDHGQPTYEELQKQLEESKAELEKTRQQLDAAYATAQRYGTEEELDEFREAIGWDLNNRDLRAFNHEPAGGGDS